MKKIIIVLVLSFFLLTNSALAEINLYFSPFDNCEDQWVQMILSAKKEIKISCFGITNEKLYNALIDRKKAGVKILVCIDRLQSKSRHDLNKQLSKAGVTTVIKKITTLEHNKMIVVDDKSGIIGSYNLSVNAQGQDNSIVVFTDEPIYASEIEAAIDRIYERDR